MCPLSMMLSESSTGLSIGLTTCSIALLPLDMEAPKKKPSISSRQNWSLAWFVFLVGLLVGLRCWVRRQPNQQWYGLFRQGELGDASTHQNFVLFNSYIEMALMIIFKNMILRTAPQCQTMQHSEKQWNTGFLGASYRTTAKHSAN